MIEEYWTGPDISYLRDSEAHYDVGGCGKGLDEVWLERATMEDDFFFSEVMNGNKALASLILNTFLDSPVRDIRSVITQSTHGWKERKGVRYDCLVRDGEGNLYDIEMQRKGEPYLNERMWYYISQMTGSIVKKGDGYSKLKGRRVASIFLLESDVFKRGEAVYTYSVRNDDTHAPLGAGGLYMYVNLCYNGLDKKGGVIHDIHCSDYRDAYNAEFRESLYEAKNDEGGIRMCETLEMFKRIGMEEANKQAISNLLRNRRLTPSEIASDFNIPLSEVLEIEKNLK